MGGAGAVKARSSTLFVRRGWERTAKATGEIEAIAIDPDVGPQPVEPFADPLADKVLRVVDVGGGVEVVACARIAASPEVVVVPTDSVCVPV